jgi:DNA-binding transcriptional ArsR family regulator
MRKEVAGQMAAASRNNPAPILRVFFELVSLEGIDLVANETGDRHQVLAFSNMAVAEQQCFVYHQTMDVDHDADSAVSRIAAAIGEPARARMLYCLVDGRARTGTELAVVADVAPSTASVHLQRLKAEKLVEVFAQGKHRYYSLDGANVAAALEALSVLAGGSRAGFVPSTPNRLRAARTCYDHIAGTLGVSLHDRFQALGWLSADSTAGNNACELTPRGTKAFESLGIDIEETRALRRRFAYACVDWSERRPHLGGALAAALLHAALRRKWILQDLDSRALRTTALGRREMMTRFGLQGAPLLAAS